MTENINTGMGNLDKKLFSFIFSEYKMASKMVVNFDFVAKMLLKLIS